MRAFNVGFYCFVDLINISRWGTCYFLFEIELSNTKDSCLRYTKPFAVMENSFHPSLWNPCHSRHCFCDIGGQNFRLQENHQISFEKNPPMRKWQTDNLCNSVLCDGNCKGFWGQWLEKRTETQRKQRLIVRIRRSKSSTTEINFLWRKISQESNVIQRD